MEKNTIIFRMGEETGIVVEKTKEQFEQSLFKDQYSQAFEIMDDIIQKSRANMEDSVSQSLSNIMAFCGDRGEGKTSALETVRRILSNKETFLEAKSTGLLPKSSNIAVDDCLVLPLIDPSFFDEKHNIVELVIGQMYEKVASDNITLSEVNNIQNDGYRTLMTKFSEAKKCLSSLEKKDDLYDALSELSILAASVRLRKAIEHLFEAYLKYYKKDRLIIGIDDIDLNMKDAYTMAENIRKYLCNNHCVILIAVKIEQLRNAIHSAIRESIKDITIVSERQMIEMANKYVTKFIPENHRIMMPSPEDIVEDILLMYDKEGELLPNINNLSVKETIVRLIFDKTRFIFYNSRYVSPIVPYNLREIIQMVGLLVSLPKISDNNGERIEDVFSSNKSIFKNYFFQSWVNNNLSIEDRVFAKELASYNDIISTNKFVVSYFKERLYTRDDGNKDSGQIDDLFDKIVKPENKSHNISVGDVFYVVRLIDNVTTDKAIKKLLFFIRSFYSMRLYELYDSITTDEEVYKFVKGDIENTNAVRIYKYDTLYEGMNNLQRFLNGSYFTYEPGTLLADIKNSLDTKNIHRDIRSINGKALAESIKNCNLRFESYAGASTNHAKDLILSVWRCEYFILCTTQQLESSSASINRMAIDPPFVGVYDNIEKRYLYFDFLAIFYNLINVKYAFNRFGDEGRKFMEYVLKLPWSLTSLMMALTSEISNYTKKDNDVPNDGRENRRKSSLKEILVDSNKLDIVIKEIPTLDMSESEMVYRYSRMLSDGCIRISEVQQSIIEELNKQRVNNKHKNDAESYQKLRWAYKDIQDIDISLQPLSPQDEKNLYHITFNFLTPIIYYLNNEIRDAFNAIFGGPSQEEEQLNEFYSHFPIAKKSGALNRSKIITMLRSANPKLPEKDDITWSIILSKEKYSKKEEWLKECLEHTDKLYK